MVGVGGGSVSPDELTRHHMQGAASFITIEPMPTSPKRQLRWFLVVKITGPARVYQNYNTFFVCFAELGDLYTLQN